MRRGGVFIFLLFLAVAVAIAPLEVAAADGSESSDSITSFSSTLGQDVLFYPDAFDDGTIELADYGEISDESYSADYVNTQALDGTPFAESSATDIEIWFAVASGVDFEGFTYSSYLRTDGGAAYFGIYNFTSTSFDNQANTIGAAYSWENGTIYDSTYWNGTHIGFQFNDASGVATLEWDYAQTTSIRLALADAAHYAESFAAIGDWTVWAPATITTDGDIASLETTAADDWNQAYCDTPTHATEGYYLEIRYKANVTISEMWIKLQTADAGAGTTIITFVLPDPVTSWNTYKGYISASGTCESIVFSGADSTSFKLDIDYLRISPADESGWQHDGSTAASSVIDNLGYGNVEYLASTDGDNLNVSARVTDGTTTWLQNEIEFDGTATQSSGEETYYPFLVIKLRCGDTTGYGVRLQTRESDTTLTIVEWITAYTTWTTLRYNLAAFGISDLEAIEFRSKGDNANEGFWVEFDYIKLFSIANETVTQSGVGTDDYLYVDSGVLYSSVDDGYIEMNHDPALSVTDTYSVWNLTTGSTSPEFSMYVSSWSTYSDNTRGATSSGTVTDIKLRFDGTEDISAIKFIEDGTAPSVVRSNSNPPEPDDDESITLSAVVTDAVEVYTVKFNAITSPAGFSDVDYSATEIADNLWTYSFSSGDLPTGYYCFKVIASDGANENTLTTEPEFLDFTVREAVIDLDAISFFGVGPDFSSMTYSFRCNRDANYTITEWTANVAAADTFTGTVIGDAMNNINWDKLDTAEATVYFNITLDTSTGLETIIRGEYQQAKSTFYWYDDTPSNGFDTYSLSFKITKSCTYAVYKDDDTLLSSDLGGIGSITVSLSNNEAYLDFIKWAVGDEMDHTFSIKFTNGSQTCWYNSSFYNPKKEAGGGGVVPTVFGADFWLGIMIAVTVCCFVAVTISKNWGDVPNIKG